MKLASRFPKTAAVLVTLLMALPASSVGNAQSVTLPDAPRIPGLPLPGPNSQCVQSAITEPALLAALNALLARQDPTTYFAQQNGDLVLCGSDGQPLPQYQVLMTQGKAILDAYNSTVQTLQQQADERDRALLPQGDVLYPTVTLLKDDFAGHRVGGVGDWRIVTEHGEDPAFHVEQVDDVNGTRSQYRFGTDAGYGRGLHQWLVSPMLDLDAVRADATTLNAIHAAENYALARIGGLCSVNLSGLSGLPSPTQFQLPGVQSSGAFTSFLCASSSLLPGGLSSPGSLIISAMTQQVQDLTQTLPVVQRAAQLDFDFSANLANGTDGVRVWLYSGDRAPDQGILFNDTFGAHSSDPVCVTDPATKAAANSLVPEPSLAPGGASGSAASETCRHAANGGFLLGQHYTGFGWDVPMPGMAPAQAFTEGAVLGDQLQAYTGDIGVGHARVDLTNLTGSRVWVLFEVKTAADDGRGGDFFNDASNFVRPTDYGFALRRIEVDGQAWYRNARVEDVGANLPLIAAGNPFGDDTNSVRVNAPGMGASPIAVDLLNAGAEVENGTLVVEYALFDDAGNVGSYTTLDSLPVVNLTPNEVRHILVAPPFAQEGTRYRVQATLNANELQNHVGDITSLNRTQITQANNTPVRVPNHAYDPTGQDNRINATVDVRAYTRHALSVLRAKGTGPALEVCSDIQNLLCTPSFTAKKGETRILQVKVRNDGSQPEDVTAQLLLTLEGVDKKSAIQDGDVRALANLLPGESRVVTWTLVPADSGIFQAVAAFTTAGNTATATAQRPVYVGRTTGMVCYDDLGADRECSATFALSQPDFLKTQSVGLLVPTPGGLLAVTQINATAGAIYLRGADGAWAPNPVANISQAALAALPPPNATVGFGTLRAVAQGPDALYFAGDNGTVLRLKDGHVTSIPLNATLAPFDLKGAAWWDGTLWVAGNSNVLLSWNQTEGWMDPSSPFNYTILVENPDQTLTPLQVPFGNGISALAVQGSTLFAATTAGRILSNDTNRWSVAYGASTVGGDFESLLVAQGQLFAVGSQNSIVRVAPNPNATIVRTYPYAIQRFAGLPVLDQSGAPGTIPDIQRAFLTPEGTLDVLTADGRLAYCGACDNFATPSWTYEPIALPPVAATGAPARILAVAATAGSISLAGDAGVFLDRVPGSTLFGNAADWDTTPLLYAKDGALEDFPTSANDGGFRGNLSAPVFGYTAFRVKLDHNILNATPQASAFVRLLYLPGPFGNVGTSTAMVNTCPRTSGLTDQVTGATQGRVPAVGSPAGSGNVAGDVCRLNGTLVQQGSLFLQDIASFTAPSRTAGWEHVEINATPGVYIGSAGAQTGGFYGVEVYKDGGALTPLRWTIDDLTVEGRDANGDWQTLLHYGGPLNRTGGIRWGPSYPVNDNAADACRAVDAQNDTAGAACSASTQSGFLPASTDWNEVTQPFYYNSLSPWHVSYRGDQPVLAANDELLGEPVTPHLRDGYNARLLSPVLDLGGTFDPVVSWRQLYAFRSYTGDSDTPADIASGDAGFVEVQYLRQGPDECPAPATSATTCGWSPFYKVVPDGGYPNGASLGADGYAALPSPSTGYSLKSGVWGDYGINGAQGKAGITLGPANPPNSKPAFSYWFRNMRPDASGTFTAQLDTANYQPASVDLARAGCTVTTLGAGNCIPSPSGGAFDITGHKVRVGFHIVTWANPTPTLPPNFQDNLWEFTGPKQQQSRTSFPGEGWYITDFKVVGANPLGIDLAATNPAFRVGYDAQRLGVGPGTTVAVNVTVENHGIYDVGGYTGSLEIRRVIDPVARTTALVATLPLAQQPALAAGMVVNHTFFWDVPSLEGARYALSFRVTPLGIDRDEDPTDNVATLGTIANGILAQSHPEFHLDAVVRPENATSQIPRAITLYIDNTGNVPLAGFTVTRRINDPFGQAVDSRSHATTRPVPQGTRVNLASVAELNPSQDIFFQPPSNKDYTLVASASVTSGQTLTDGLTRTIRSLDAFVYDDADTGLTGEAFRGTWTGLNATCDGGSVWCVQSPGFRSDAAFGFGDATNNRYAPNSDASAQLPTVDVGSARDAKVAFYTRYQFEPGFDGGALQASADGGKTWTNLPASADPLNALPQGVITDTPLAASSPLHPTGNPDNVAYVFGGDSSTLPQAADGGWVFSQFDLTRFANVTQTNVSYAFYRNGELAGYIGLTNNSTLRGDVYDPAVYTNASWGASGDDLAARHYWEVHNLTQDAGAADATLRDDAIAPPTHDGGVWWSGSASWIDDQKSPTRPTKLDLGVDLQNITDPRTKVTVDWWEWLDRTGEYFHAITPSGSNAPATPGVTGFYDAYTGLRSWATRHITQASRFNVSTPSVVESQGRWYHMVSDVSAHKGTKFNVSFVYSPQTQSTCDNSSLANRVTCYGGGTGGTDNLDDRGFAIDGFHVTTSQVIGGKDANVQTILSTSDAWAHAVVTLCPANLGSEPNFTKADSVDVVGCMAEHGPDYSQTWDAYTVVPRGDPSDPANYAARLGISWSRVPSAPGLPSGWGVVKVKDPDGYGMTTNDLTNPLGETPYAWYTGFPGDPHCPTTKGSSGGYDPGLGTVPCPTPGSESRLVTPVLDLSRIAGESATFSFWQRFAFESFWSSSADYALDSGGVVEIQTYNPATDTWGAWQQLYSRPDAMTPCPMVSGKEVPCLGSAQQIAYDGAGLSGAAPARGGYTSFTVNASPTGFGQPIRYDPPFQPVAPPASSRVHQDVQFLYSGSSTALPYATASGWVPARYDLSAYLGQKVRLGFHVMFSGHTATSQANAVLAAPDGADGLRPGNSGGWWVTNVSLVGDVLAGGPVQLRLRAATDGSVNDGHWQVDDVSVFGQRYSRNVAIFADEGANHTTLAGHSMTIPVTVRNLGSTVRRGLAIESHFAGGAGAASALQLSGEGPAGNYSDPATPSARTYLVDPLAPGQAETVVLTVDVPSSVPANTTGVLVLNLREFNPIDPRVPYVNITDNEVRGFLQRVLNVYVAQNAPVSLVGQLLTPGMGVVGAPANITVTVANLGSVPAVATLACSAEIYDHNVPTDHTKVPGREPDVDRATFPDCGTARVSLGGNGQGSATFGVTPQVAGILAFRLALHVDDGTVGGVDVPAKVFEMPIATSPQPYASGFDNPSDVVGSGNWSTLGGDSSKVSPCSGGCNRPAVDWSSLRGHNAPGAMEIGTNESIARYSSASSYNAFLPKGGYFEARSPIIDLHNYTKDQPAFLSFWHMERLALGDGADVSAEVIGDETKPENSLLATEDSCKLYPLTGYEGGVDSWYGATTPNPSGPPTAGPADANGAVGVEFPDGSGQGIDNYYNSSDRYGGRFDYFVSNGSWEEGWSKAVFDLSNQPRCADPSWNPGADATQFQDGPRPDQRVSLLGHDIRLVFRVWIGPSDARVPASPLHRGRGQAWLLDDLSVGPYNLVIRPASAQRAVLLDNVTKSFNVLVENHGSFADRVRISLDAPNSSTPEGSLALPQDVVELQPGESRVLPVGVTLPRDPSLLPTTFRATLRVSSLLDGAAGASTPIDLVFAPRSLPDLGVALAVPTGSAAVFQEGTDTVIPITVDNHGLLESVPTRVHVVDHWVEGNQDVAYDIPVPAIPSYFTSPDASVATLELHWKPARGTVGTHILTATVDPDVLSEEYSRIDNVAQATLPVSPLLIPDLNVTADNVLTVRNALGSAVDAAHDADVSRYEVTAGELVTFELRVANTGRSAATGVDVRASIGSLTLPAKTIPFLPAGGQALVSFTWLAQRGEYNLTFDVRNEQLQLSTDNDHYPGKGLTLLVVKGYQIRLDLGELPNPIASGDEVKMPFNVTNDGNAGEDIQLVAQAPPGVTVTLPRAGMYLREGETYAGVAKVDIGADAVAGAPSPQFIRVLAVSRENPMKVASGETPLAVRAEYAGSLVATVASGAPPLIVVPLTARNEGNSLEPWTVTATLPAGWSAQETLPAKLVVPPRGQATLALHVRVPSGTAPGPQAVQLHATMPDGEARDGAVSVSVLPVRVASATVLGDQAKPAEGALAYPVTVENVGNTQTPFEMLLTGVPAGVDASIQPATFDLAPGAKTVATLLVKPNASVLDGTLPITGYALFPGVTPDTAEGRANVQTLKVSLARPDFRVSTLEYAPRAGLAAGERITVTVPVANAGSGPASDVTVHLYVDDYFVGETTIPALEAGGKTEVTLNWTALPGQHTLTAVVDPYNETVDPVTTDNAVSALVDVGGSGVAGGLAAQRANVPGPDLFVSLLALAAVAAALAVIPIAGSRRPPK